MTHSADGELRMGAHTVGDSRMVRATDSGFGSAFIGWGTTVVQATD